MTNVIEKAFVPGHLVVYDRHNTVSQDSAEWHDCRATTIGSSESAAVFPSGISSTFKPSQLHRKLRGEPYRDKMDDFVLACCAAGKRMEPVLRSELWHILHTPVAEVGLFTSDVFLHGCGKNQRISASPDGLLYKESDDGSFNVALAEFKWRANGTADWKGGLGMTVFCQVQHQMRCVFDIVKCRELKQWPRTFVYVGGAKDNSRSLWVVRYAPEYVAMWDQWADEFVDNCSDSSPQRAENGSRAGVERSLQLYIKEYAHRVVL